MNSRRKLQAIAAVVLFYLFAAAGALLLAVLIVVEFVFGCLGGRRRWTKLPRRALRAHFALLKILLRAGRNERAREAWIALSRAEAPGIFSIIDRICSADNLAPPGKVLLEMPPHAWVRVERRGAAVLGLGFDLLAGLSASELETVLAHELIHARLRRPALQDWLTRGWERAARLARELTSRSPKRNASTESRLKRLARAAASELAELTGRALAESSRAEEFRADQGAAERCGNDATRAALLRVETLRRAVARLSWRERLAQFQAHTYSNWLQRELSQITPLSWQQIAAETPDPLSSHPSLRERLNALGGPLTAPPNDEEPALRLLADPSAVAERLMKAGQAAVIEEEEKDTRALRRWARQMRAASQLSNAQQAGCMLVILAEAAGVIVTVTGASFQSALIILATAILGLTVFWLGRFREGFVLPAPDFGLLKTTWPADAVFRERRQISAPSAAQRAGGRALAEKSRAALAECDYARAYPAAQLSLQKEAESVPALLVVAIAGAWLGEIEESAHSLALVQRMAGLRGPSICWGAAWAFMLRGNWTRGEALLQESLDKRPNDPTLLNLRALCQLRRGKIQSAIVNARKACQPRPRNREHAKFLIDLLLEGGYLGEAAEHLTHLEKFIAEDDELLLTAVRLNLLRRELDAARHFTRLLLEKSPAPFFLVRLAVFYELARLPEEAADYYRRALAVAYYPDACLGLARLAAERNAVAEARQHTLQALNLRRGLGPYATPPMELLSPILGQLTALEPSKLICRGWIAELARDVIPGAVANSSFLIYAPDQARAETQLGIILGAMVAGNSVSIAPKICWSIAPPDQQPMGAVPPGIRPLANEFMPGPIRRGFRRSNFVEPAAAPEPIGEFAAAVLV